MGALLMRSYVRQNESGVTLPYILVLFLGGVVGVLILASARKWSVARMGVGVLLVIMVSGLLVMIVGGVTAPGVMSVVLSGVVALAISIAERTKRDTTRASGAKVISDDSFRNPEYAIMDDDQVQKLTVELTGDEARKLRPFLPPIFILMALCVLEPILGDRLGIPGWVMFVVAAGFCLLVMPPFYLTFRRSTVRSQEILLELTLRGLEQPAGRPAVTPRGVVMTKRLWQLLPLLGCLMLILFSLLPLYLYEIVRGAFWEPVLMGLLACLLLCTGWMLAIVLFTRDPLKGVSGESGESA